ncbi:hypothetical protein ACTMMZ_28755, partial [Escherichia coli]
TLKQATDKGDAKITGNAEKLNEPWLFTTAAGVVWDRLPTADPGGPATISSQAYAYYMQNVPFCIFVPTAHRDLSLVPVPDCSTGASCSAVRIRRHTASPDGGAVALVTQNIVIVIECSAGFNILTLVFCLY